MKVTCIDVAVMFQQMHPGGKMKRNEVGNFLFIHLKVPWLSSLFEKLISFLEKILLCVLLSFLVFLCEEKIVFFTFFFFFFKKRFYLPSFLFGNVLFLTSLLFFFHFLEKFTL